MNWVLIGDKWNRLKEKVKESWGELTDEDLNVIDGKRQRFIGYIQEKYGFERGEAEKRVREWQKTLKL